MKNIQFKKKARFGVSLLPSFFTTCSMFFGFYAIVASINSLCTETPKFGAAALSIIIAGFFDGIDGRVARLTKTTSEFGVQYDSLSDLASFTLAPSILFYTWALKPYGRVGWLAAFVFFACGALRLARFNTKAGDETGKKHFQGLPTPAAAGSIATIVLFNKYLHGEGGVSHFYLVLWTFILAFLMVSNFKYKSFKDIDIVSKRPFKYLLLIVFLIIIIASRPEVVLFIIGMIYVLSAPIESFLRKIIKRKKSF